MSILKRFFIDEEGQTVIEYILLIVVAVGLVGAFAFGLKRTLLRLWQILACEIAAPCPSCPAPEGVIGRLAQGCRE